MDAKHLPARPSLEQYKKQAKDFVKGFKSADREAIQRTQKFHLHADKFLGSTALKAKFALADAQLIIAREHGFESWPRFAKHIQSLTREVSFGSVDAALTAFIEAACVPLNASHGSGTLEDAEAIRAANPESGNKCLCGRDSWRRRGSASFSCARHAKRYGERRSA